MNFHFKLWWSIYELFFFQLWSINIGYLIKSIFFLRMSLVCYNFRSKIIRLKTRIQRNMFRHKLYLWLFVFWLMVCILKWRYSSKIISNILIINLSFKIYLNFWALMQGLLYRWTEPSVDFFWKNDHWVREKGPPNYTPGWSFWNMTFYNLKKFTSRSIQWGVILIFEFTSVGRWAAQTQPFFVKFPEITDFGLLQQSQNRLKFWIC